VRVQENGVGSIDVSEYFQDHGMPLDRLSTPQQISGFSITASMRSPTATPLPGHGRALHARPVLAYMNQGKRAEASAT
jgi:hypothetical protein